MKKNTKVVYDNKGRYLSVPTDYVNALFMNNQRAKGRAFLEYNIDLQNDEINSIRFYAKSWDIGKSTVERWTKEFKEEIARYHAYWTLKNQNHYTSVANKVGHKEDTKNMEVGHTNNTIKPIKSSVDNMERDTKNMEVGHKEDKDLNTSNIDNINVESKDCDNDKSSSNTTYSQSFELLWQHYDKKSGSKKRAYQIYNRRWKRTDYKILMEAINEYKENLDLTYLKDFDGFLNGVIDTFIPKRAWVIDRNNNKHLGFYYDSKNKFISDANESLSIPSENIVNYMQQKRFGYVS